MKKFLVVGCGGSGAATQAYMMDQLKAFLKTIDPHRTKLPESWQFVTVDVPIVPEAGPQGLPNVTDAGGTYVSVGASQNYAAFDKGLSQVLGSKKALGEIATWASRSPETRDTPISAGAGQFRGIGRMLTIQSLPKVRAQLEEALQRIKNGSRELQELNIQYNNDSTPMDNEKPLIFVISSMAGGAGASMFLDICRLLTTIDGVEPTETVAFMYTPEVFESLAKDQSIGQWPNALAVFGEAIAAQFGTAVEHDARLFRALGIGGSPQRSSIGRMIPIGSRMGGQGTAFGDGSADSVYRGLGRALAALMSSEKASRSFKSYTLANTGVIASDRGLHGWGDPHDPSADFIPWGSMGYAQLSMGRDRYAEYSAQRLSRSAFERLLHGHIDADSDATGTEQLDAKLRDYYPLFLKDTGLPEGLYRSQLSQGEVDNWIFNIFGKEGNEAIARMNAVMRESIPNGDGLKSRDWHDTILARINDPRLDREMHAIVEDVAYRAVHRYADVLANTFVANIEQQIARFGVPYTEKLVDRLREAIQENLVEFVNKRGESVQNMRVTAQPAELSAHLQPLNGKGTVNNSAQLVSAMIDAYRNQFTHFVAGAFARKLAPVLQDFAVSALAPLQKSLSNIHADLNAAEAKVKTPSKFADVTTYEPKDWPRDDDERVDKRFFGSANEIVISKVENFGHDYEAHIMSTQNEKYTADAIRSAIKEIILGKWETESAVKAPNDTLAPQLPADAVVGNRMGWVSRSLVEPIGGVGERRETRKATFEIRLRPYDLLDRARLWIQRPNKPFSDFIELDLRTYLSRDNAANDADFSHRIARLRAAFSEAIEKARPLAAVSTDMVARAYKGQAQVQYRYSFSEIPFEATETGDILREVLKGDSNIDATTKTTFDDAQTQSRKIRSIEVFGAYPAYTPLVFSSLLPHIAHDWNSRSNKESFWELRRSRPLPAALPLTNKEREAMVAGWLIGMALKRIYIDNPGTEQACAYIWDEENTRWLSFPKQLLTPPRYFRKSYDWMPAILESVLLAYANSHDVPPGGAIADSMRPYHVLRGLYDNGIEGPTTGDINRSVVSVLAAWLRTGQQPPLGTDNPAPATLEERYEAALSYFKKYEKLSLDFIPTTDGAFVPGTGSTQKPFADVTDRNVAKMMPLFHDVAPDTFKMARELQQWLAEAKVKASQPEQSFSPSATPVQHNDSSLPQLPDFGDAEGDFL
ncbi:hypothetical protein EML15_08870 [Corynebacterium sp. sy017]|uniref:tubulin-like doman-containing protein n=1 Tax=unclassified Corynebacterium TaxID=2624378 RepID=UPI0011861C15|nr:tubulin-like doman-containing protein [Corynebacterium sp. SY003]MBP3089256.1 hypothetical protein [Corynebacterium sp. sy017]TSD91037.1 hypothetical protein ELY17_09730 [Corynebacterium sp. SY003]